jgi:hypothetical protein
MTMKTRLVVLGVIAMLVALAGCSKTSTVKGSGGLSGSSPSTSPTVPATSAGSTPTTGTSATSTATGTHTKTAAAGPTIDYFAVSQKPACPVVATSASPFAKDGVDIKLKWKVTGGASKVALSLDDKDFFKTYGSGTISDYPTTDEIDLAFSCDPTVQPNTTHTYYLDTIGGGSSVRKVVTITVQTSP